MILAALLLSAHTLTLPRIGIYGGAAFADLSSTEIALSHGGMEGHPFMRDRAARIVLKSASTLGMMKLDVWLGRRNRPVQWTVRGVWVVGNGWVAFHNLRQKRTDRTDR